MVTIKSYTDIEQSKKLAVFLPIESADMIYPNDFDFPFVWIEKPEKDKNAIPCWSLTTLFDILPDGTDIMKDKTDTENEKYMCSVGVKGEVIYTFGSNPVDCCVEMVLKLKGFKMM